jgi:murein DD-endopeptidase MepM/ murein hydrolase activator NlpD
VATLQEEARRAEEARKAAEAAAAAKKKAAQERKAAEALAAKKKALADADSRTSAVGADWVFPVAGPNSFSSTFGAPRSGGRTHQGADIFTARNTPIVAVVDGVIRSTSPAERGLGGITIHLTGSDGNVYYYAHLSSIKSGIRSGLRVTAGQVIGYAGNTGNARTTPVHLHFEIRPGGGAAINPYPILVKYR